MVFDATVPLFLLNLTYILIIMFVAWLFSLRTGDVSFIDSLWGLGFVIIAWTTYGATGKDPSPHRLLILFMVTIWGLRLAGHLYRRWRTEGPDRRYKDFLKHQHMNPKLFSLFFVFLLQGFLLTVVAAPVYMGQVPTGSETLGPLAILGGAIWLIGFLFEAIADSQLWAFKQNPDNEGKVMDKGLWHYSRHPNYFGEALLWWGVYMVAAESPIGIWSFFGPALLTFMLLKWSGIPLLEKDIHGHRPDYGYYKKRTSAFLPLPPKKQS